MSTAVAALHLELGLNAQKLNAGLKGVDAAIARTHVGAVKNMGGASQAVNRLGEAHKAGARTAGVFGQRMQQAGYQVQDFAVQVAGGQGALRAFGQQAPQFLGAFGPAGAIAGAVISVGVLATQFALSGANAKGAAKEIETYAAALERFRGEQEKVRFGGLSVLGKKEDLEKQLAESKRVISELFEFSNQKQLQEERKGLVRALAAPGVLSSDASSIAMRERIRQIDERSSDKAVEETNTRIRQEQEKMLQLQQAIAAKGKEINETEVKGNAAVIESTQERSRAQQAFSEQLDADLRKVRDRAEADELAIQKEVAGIKAALDPLSDYRAELEKIERFRSRLTAGEYDAATGSVRGQMVDAELKAFFGEMDANGKLYQNTEKLSDAAQQMGFAFSSAFEDAILEAGKLGDVVNGLIKDIARMAIRSAITAPLGNWVGGMFSGIFGGARASGGPVDSGKTYMVGEKGPELFTPSSSGNITPNHKLSSAGGGDNIAVTYNIGSGVTASQLMPILAMHKRDIIGTLADAKRRRTPMGAAMA